MEWPDRILQRGHKKLCLSETGTSFSVGAVTSFPPDNALFTLQEMVDGDCAWLHLHVAVLKEMFKYRSVIEMRRVTASGLGMGAEL